MLISQSFNNSSSSHDLAVRLYGSDVVELFLPGEVPIMVQLSSLQWVCIGNVSTLMA